jgi:guanylate kinase
MTSGVILYGPPAAGKDTITRALTAHNDRFRLFPRLKVGPGRTTGYRLTGPETLERLRHDRHVIWENSRYQATYVIDAPELHQRLRDHHPVLHLGQIDGVRAVVAATPDAHWLLVHLWCPRDIARQRLIERGSTDLAERLHAWDDTPALPDAALTINTADVSADQAATLILTNAPPL